MGSTAVDRLQPLFRVSDIWPRHDDASITPAVHS
jgi:hypothetical protein